MSYTDNLIDTLAQQGLVRIPQAGDYPTEQAGQVATDNGLLILNHETVIRIAHEYGCTRRQAIRIINAQQSYAALHNLLIELANDERIRRSQ